MNKSKETIKATMNPLMISSLHNFGTENLVVEPIHLLNELCGEWGGNDVLNNLISRYDELCESEKYIPIFPHTENIHTRITTPLLKAKQSLVLRNYLGCIALCGMVCEMICILIFDMTRTVIPKKQWTAEWTDIFSKNKYESKLNHLDRLKFLKNNGSIKDEFLQTSKNVNTIRKHYQHFFSKSRPSIEEDARNAYLDTVKVVGALFEFHFDKGKLIIPEFLKQYLEKK